MTVTIFENYIYIIKTQVFMFRYEHVNSTRKFTIVAEIVSLLKKIYKRDAPFRAGFKVKTLAVLFPPYLREMKQIPRNLNLPPFWCLLFFYGNGTTHSHGRSIDARGLSMRTHLTSVDLWSRFLVLTKRSAVSGNENETF